MMRYAKSFFWILLASLVAFYIGQFGNKTKSKPPPVVIHDTIPTIRVDTVIRFLEKVTWKRVYPETVVVYRNRIRIDTVYGMEPELMISLSKIGKRLKVQAIRSGEVHEYTYTLSPFSRDWIIRSKGKGFFRTGEANMDNWQEIVFRDCLGEENSTCNIAGTRYQTSGVAELFNTGGDYPWSILEAES